MDNKLIGCSAGDHNYDSTISKLTDEDLIYNLLNEGSKTAWRKLKREAEKRGLERPFEICMKEGKNVIIMAKSRIYAARVARDLNFEYTNVIDKWEPKL